MVPNSFQNRKAKILNELSTPEAQYQDLSPKGSVDEGIRELISEINASPEYVTTSSCAGRMAVYLEGSKGAKGGGKWLFTSHDAVELSHLTTTGSLYQAFGLSPNDATSVLDSGEARFVHFKFEPMVGHPRLTHSCCTLRLCSLSLHGVSKDPGTQGPCLTTFRSFTSSQRACQLPSTRHQLPYKQAFANLASTAS